ncbi:MAG: GPW/gp25 family protein, partial [Hyphomicrobium sp.]
SIEDILTTRVLTRVMRRAYGSNGQKLIDAPMNDYSLLMFQSETADALDEWEPRFKLLEVYFVDASAGGNTSLRLVGDYLPRGHLGDTTPANDTSLVLDLVQMAEQGFRAVL